MTLQYYDENFILCRNILKKIINIERELHECMRNSNKKE